MTTKPFIPCHFINLFEYFIDKLYPLSTGVSRKEQRNYNVRQCPTQLKFLESSGKIFPNLPQKYWTITLFCISVDVRREGKRRKVTLEILSRLMLSNHKPKKNRKRRIYSCRRGRKSILK